VKEIKTIAKSDRPQKCKV